MTKTRYTCPYTSLPDHAYWRRSVAGPAPEAINPVVNPKFHIGPGDRMATAGSCFAQHIARFMRANGYNYLVAEPGHPMLTDALCETYNYGTFSARYGNVYTTRQLRQLLERAYGLRVAMDDIWTGPKGFIDPYRPHIQPDGFATEEEYRADREQHYRAIRAIVETSDVFVFTLGLTETWENIEDGMVYPLCPGCGAGTFDPARYRFRNLTVAEVIEDLSASIAFMRERNPGLRVLLTVSPVPLIATFEPRDVLVSTTYSKSVLRVAAQSVADADPKVDYFPSYEIITGPAARGAYYKPDLREIEPEGVAHVMRCFATGYLGIPAAEQQAVTERKVVVTAPTRADPEDTVSARAARLVCDEERLLDD